MGWVCCFGMNDRQKVGEWGRQGVLLPASGSAAGHSSKMLSHHLGQAGSSKITSVTFYSL